jgi:hypothetical protein
MAQENPAREERITMEIIVDAYSPEERAMGWYYYLEEKIQFPFTAAYVTSKSTSSVQESERVTVIAMASEDECEHEMFVEIEWDGDTLAIPLSQLEVLDATDETQEAVDDWLYWVDQGYEFD